MFKRFLSVVVCFVCISVAYGIDARFVMPNMEATWFHDFTSHGTELGASSKFAYIGDFDARLGYYQNIGALGLSYDFVNLNKLGLRVGYAWSSDWKLITGIGVGYNFETQKISGNIQGLILQIGLK